MLLYRASNDARKFSIWAGKRFKWTMLAGVCNGKLASILVMMPAVGFIVVYNERFSAFLTLESEPSDCGYLGIIPFVDVRMDILYVGLVTMGLATLMFRIFCPPVIRQFRDGRKFAESREKSSYYDIVGGLLSITASSERVFGPIAKWTTQTVGAKDREIIREATRFHRCSRFPISASNRLMAIYLAIEKELATKKDAALINTNIRKLKARYRLASGANDQIGRVEYLVEFGILLRRNHSISSIQGIRENLAHDIFNTQYIFANNRQLLPRFVILFLLSLGAVLTLFPTFVTLLYAFDKICIFSI